MSVVCAFLGRCFHDWGSETPGEALVCQQCGNADDVLDDGLCQTCQNLWPEGVA